jgi:hypothetical protein
MKNFLRGGYLLPLGFSVGIRHQGFSPAARSITDGGEMLKQKLVNHHMSTDKHVDLGLLRFLPLVGKTLIALCLVALLGLPVFAAITGDLQGTVFDPQGSAVLGATVVIKETATGVVRSVKTSDSGEFSAQQLAVGEYSVRIEKQGFRVMETKVVIRSGEITRLNLNLEIGAITEIVTVEAGATTIMDVASSQISTSLDTKAVLELPNLGRDPVAYATLAPGVAPVSKDNPFLGSGSFNANGQRGRGNNITVDNITATDISTTGSSGTGTFSLDSVQEFKLITNNFSAEFGRNNGAQVQIITKSGTNDYHGTAYWFHQNAALNARDFFDTTGKATPFIQNQWGFTAGGPVVKNHLFAFGHYEGIKNRGAGSSSAASVLTPADKAAITDPTSVALFDALGAPTSDTGALNAAGPNAGDQYAWSLRIDENFRGGKDSITARYGTNPISSVSPGLTFIFTNLPNYGANVTSTDRAFNFGHTHIFTPAIVNQFRFAFGRSNPNFVPFSTLSKPYAPETLITGVDGMGIWTGIPQGRVQNTFQYSDSVSWSKGVHGLKFGADVFRYQANSVFDSNLRGTVSFNSVADFQAGIPFSYTQRFGTSIRGNRSTDLFLFAQDDIRVTSTFTLNLGVRLETSGGVSEVNQILANLDRNNFSPLGGGGTGPLGSLDLGGQAFARNNNWAPRLGAAWNPRNGRFVLRGGYGWAYDYIFLNPITNLRFSSPFMPSITLTGSAISGANSYANLMAGTAQAQTDAIAAIGVFLPTQQNFGSISPVDQNLKNPRAAQWNGGVEFRLFKDFVVKGSYVGTQTKFLQVSRPINLIPDELRPAPATSLADEDARRLQFTGAFAKENGQAPLGAPFNIRLDHRFNTVTQIQSIGTAIYHGLQVDVSKQLSHGLSFDAAYTYSHAIDDISDSLGVLVNDSANFQDPRNPSSNRASSQFDLRHRFSVYHLWEIPWTKRFHGFAGKALDGWALNGIFSIQSGFPTSIFSGTRRGVSDAALLGGGTVRADGDPTQFTPVPFGSPAAANIPGNPDNPGIGVPGGPGTACGRQVGNVPGTGGTVACDNASGFPLTQPLLGNFGTSPRNSLRLDNLVNFDMGILKNTRITERVNLQFRWEMYNVFNHANFSGFQNTLTSAFFGTYTTTATDQRKMQGSLKLIF